MDEKRREVKRREELRGEMKRRRGKGNFVWERYSRDRDRKEMFPKIKRNKQERRESRKRREQGDNQG